jgi:DNA-binding transcriptional MerR regulator
VSERRLRPVDLAREHGLSAQAVRNYEEQGILSTAGRTRHGYRIYTPLHARALSAFVALVPAHGHGTATGVMRAVNTGDVDAALTLLDESHAQLLRDRETLAAVEKVLLDLTSSETLAAPRPGKEVFIGQLARELGVGPATLRKWERAGLLNPRRDPETGYRVYSPADVRDARLAHQLRRGGYLLRQIAPLIERVRHAGGVGPLEATLEGWRARLTTRGLSMLAAASELSAYVENRTHPSSAFPSA